MISYLLAGPATEPVTLAEAKAFLRLDDSAEDALVATLITAARLHIEATTGKALLSQSWRVVLDAWPAEGAVRLPVSPLISVTSATAYDEAGGAHAIALAQFQTEAAPARLLLPPTTVEGMPVLRQRQGIEIDYAAGFGGAAADVPADLRQALLLLVGSWFENRDSASEAIPAGFGRLVAPYRAVRL